MHIGSLGLRPGVLVLNLKGPMALPTFDGAAKAIVTLSPSCAGRSTDCVANLCVKASPFGARI